MAMGRRKREEQGALWIAASELPQSGGHPFYQQVNKILEAEGFDRFVEKQCRAFYAEQVDRPSLPLTVYFRMLLIGCFDGIDSERGIAWRVADKGYHSNAVLKDPCPEPRRERERDIRTYISEPDRGRRNWEGKLVEREAVYGNRRRIRGARGKRLMRRRGELVERSFAHCYDTGGMRRTHLREHSNILKRLLVHIAGFNLSLVLRKILGLGTARGLQGLTAAALRLLCGSGQGLAARRVDLWTALRALWIDVCRIRVPTYAGPRRSDPVVRLAA